MTKNRSYILIFLSAFLLPLAGSFAQEKGEETYSISLVQTAEVDKEIITLDDKKILAEEITIQRGEHLWGILRRRKLLKKRDLPQLLAILKKLNRSLTNLDLIHPGEKILIPLTITPIERPIESVPERAPQEISIKELEDLDLETYTVRSGESLIRIINKHYDVPKEDLHDEYLKIVKKLNPRIDDLNRIYPGQKIRLPIYSPQIVRAPIVDKPQKMSEAPKPPEPPREKKAPKPPEKSPPPIGQDLEKILTLMGEEWVGKGQHFIPLKSGGQIKLKADSFPIINLVNGHQVIVDLHNDLPEKMAKLISSSWEGYKIVHLLKEDDLRGALEKIFARCDFHRILRAGEPLELGGDLPLRLTADWIISRASKGPEKKNQTIMVNLIDPPTPGTPKSIKAYLEGLRIKTVDYPSSGGSDDGSGNPPEILTTGERMSNIVQTVLGLIGRKASRQVEIPVYQSQKSDFNLIVNADFFLNVRGRDGIIDLTGLGPEILSLLREHQFLVLSLSGMKDPVTALSKILEFTDTPFQPGPHAFMATARPENRNIRLTIPGITFQNEKGEAVFATPLNLPDEIARFLASKGYRLLILARPKPSNP